jgi:hypothetical protein
MLVFMFKYIYTIHINTYIRLVLVVIKDTCKMIPVCIFILGDKVGQSYISRVDVSGRNIYMCSGKL